MGFEKIRRFPEYYINEKGDIKGKRVKLLKPALDKDGYLIVSMYRNGKRTVSKVHILVAETFLPNPNNLTEVNHKDEDKTNPHLDNLEWCTSQYNIEYSMAKNFLLLSPEDKVVPVFNLRKFCREQGLDQGHMSGVTSGRYKSCKKWRSYVRHI